jgi:nitrogen fixation NifU-like protein
MIDSSELAILTYTPDHKRFVDSPELAILTYTPAHKRFVDSPELATSTYTPDHKRFVDSPAIVAAQIKSANQQIPSHSHTANKAPTPEYPPVPTKCTRSQKDSQNFFCKPRAAQPQTSYSPRLVLIWRVEVGYCAVYQGGDMYSSKVVEACQNPQNVGSLDASDSSVGTGIVGAPVCGDVLKLQIKVSDDGIIEDAKFKTFGCGSAIAASSLVTTLIKGKSVEDALKVRNTEIAEILALPPIKVHCSVLAESAVKSAVDDYKTKKAMGLKEADGVTAAAAAATAAAKQDNPTEQKETL